MSVMKMERGERQIDKDNKCVCVRVFECTFYGILLQFIYVPVC